MRKVDISRAVCREFPNSSTHELARVVVKRYPDMFLTYEQARKSIMYARGKNGQKCRDEMGDIPAEPPPSAEKKSQYVLPEPVYMENSGGISFEFKHAAVLSDIHIPYHDKDALMLCIDEMVRRDVDCIVLNGDIVDFYAISRWETNPRERNLANEVDKLKQFLFYLRQTFQNSKILYSAGNHEERWEKYLYHRAPELVGIEDFQLPRVLELEDCRIDYLTRRNHIQLGKVNIIHGHEYGGRGGGVNPARWLFTQAHSTAMCGHFHRSSSHSEPSMNKKVTGTWSTGCLCNLSPDFAILNKWNQGMAFVHSGEGGLGAVENLKVVEGRLI